MWIEVKILHKTQTKVSFRYNFQKLFWKNLKKLDLTLQIKVRTITYQQKGKKTCHKGWEEDIHTPSFENSSSRAFYSKLIQSASAEINNNINLV